MDNINRGHNAGKRNRRPRPTEKPKSGAVQTITVDPLLWRQRLGHDAERLLWADAATLIVCNSRRHRDYMRRILNHG